MQDSIQLASACIAIIEFIAKLLNIQLNLKFSIVTAKALVGLARVSAIGSCARISVCKT